MTKTAPAPNLHGVDRETLSALVREMGESPYRAAQIFRGIHAGGARTFDEITTLSRDLRHSLASAYAIERPRVAERSASTDGTVKYRVDLPGGGQVEAVALPDRGRWTFCLSSQAGCALGCTFCMTALLGPGRNLTPGEIVGQAEILAAESGIAPAQANLVYMGMGEPLQNYEAVLASIAVLRDPDGLGVARRRITVSTAGLVPEIERLAGEADPPALAISLNATEDGLRRELMPIARRWPLPRLMDAARLFASDRRRRLTIEYVLLAGINDDPASARRLVTLLHGVRARVNLIPFNPTSSLPYSRPSAEAVHAFRDRLRDRGVRVSVRRSRGRDVDGACGQLAFRTGSGPSPRLPREAG